MGYLDDIKSVAKDTCIPFESFEGCNILVTGATGLIGSCLIRVLLSIRRARFDVYALGRNESRAKNLFSEFWNATNFHFIQHDILKPLTCKTPFQYIIHAASHASPSAFVSSPVEVIKSNITGVANLLDYGRGNGLKRFLYVSSGEVYGQGDGRVFEESYSGYVDCTTLRSCYPTSKRAAESLCVAYTNEYGTESVIARPCHVYGPDFTESDNRAYAQFFRNAENREDIVLKSSGSQRRSWCYVVDCVSALLTILLKGQSGEAYNVADDRTVVSIRQLAETIASYIGKRVLFEIPEELESKGYNVVTESVYNIDKLKSLGWEPRHSIENGIKSSIEWLILK